jgi:hypothetical protein
MEGTILQIDQSQFIRQQSPAIACERRAQGALARAWRSWENEGTSVPLENRSVQDQVLMRMTRHAPVQSPLEHGNRLIGRERLERNPVVVLEQDLRPPPATQSPGRRDADVEIDECFRLPQRLLRVQQGNVVGDVGDIRADA